MPNTNHEKTNEVVQRIIIENGYSLNGMSGTQGEFFTTNREEDAREMILEIINEYL